MLSIIRFNILLLCTIVTSTALRSQNYHWANTFGANNYDNSNALVVDNSGNVYTLGHFNDTIDFDPGPNVFNLIQTCPITGDMFISKLDSVGKFVWAKRIGLNGMIDPFSITIDEQKNTYSTGFFEGSIDFDPGEGTAIFSTNSPTRYAFVLKLDSMGNYLWCKTWGGMGSQVDPISIEYDKNGSLVLTGFFDTHLGSPIDFDPGPGVILMQSSFEENAFVSKMDTSGNLIWSRGFISPNNSSAAAIGVSAVTTTLGNIYVTGNFRNTSQNFIDFDPGAGTYSLNTFNTFTYNDIFIVKLNAAGNFVWAKSLGGTTEDVARQIVTDNQENIYVTGYYADSVDFDPGPLTFTLASAGYYDAFIFKLDANGNYQWAKSIGGPGDDNSVSISKNNNGELFITGSFSVGCDFDPSPATYTINCTGSWDAFIIKLSNSGNLQWVKSVESQTAYSGSGGNYVSTDSKQNIYITGLYYGPVDLNTDLGTNIVSSAAGSFDVFVLKLGACNIPLNVSSSLTICANQCTTLMATGAQTYTWNAGPNTPQYSVCPVNTTTYSVSGLVSSNCIRSNSVVVTIDPCTNVSKNLPNENYFIIFPNPSKEYFMIKIFSQELSSAEFSILDISGKQVYSRNVNIGKEIEDIKINTEDLSNGFYTTLLKTKNGSVQNKLIITK